MAIDFKKFAEDVARRGEVEALLPIVEKELIHYDIIRALDESRWLDGLTFQGGTCLRLCYGAVRYSEDLDFTTALDLEESDLAGFQELLSDSLRSKYDVGVRVKDPKKIKHFEGGGRWSSTRRRRDPIFLPRKSRLRSRKYPHILAIFAFLRKTIRKWKGCAAELLSVANLWMRFWRTKSCRSRSKCLPRAIAIYGTFPGSLCDRGGIWTRLRSWLVGN